MARYENLAYLSAVGVLVAGAVLFLSHIRASNSEPIKRPQVKPFWEETNFGNSSRQTPLEAYRIFQEKRRKLLENKLDQTRNDPMYRGE